MSKKLKPSISESTCIQRAKSDPNAFAPLYEKYYALIFRFVFSRVQNEHVAADVTSQVFLKAMVGIKKYEDRGFPFSSWLYRIAINECNLFFRSQKKTIAVQVDLKFAQEMNEEGELELEEEHQYGLVDAMNLLKFEEANLIELRFFQKMRFQEIGTIYKITEANAKIKTYRVLKKLKKILIEGGRTKA